MEQQTDRLTIYFRCPPELESILPRPIPAVRGLPDWFKALPQHNFSTVANAELMTVKKCPPFIDAMTYMFFNATDGTIQLPPGYSLLVTHPVNATDGQLESRER